MENKSTKVNFSPISFKKYHSTFEMDTFKVKSNYRSGLCEGDEHGVMTLNHNFTFPKIL